MAKNKADRHDITKIEHHVNCHYCRARPFSHLDPRLENGFQLPFTSNLRSGLPIFPKSHDQANTPISKSRFNHQLGRRRTRNCRTTDELRDGVNIDWVGRAVQGRRKLYSNLAPFRSLTHEKDRRWRNGP